MSMKNGKGNYLDGRGGDIWTHTKWYGDVRAGRA